MKKIILILTLLPALSFAREEIMAEDHLKGLDLIEIVRRESREADEHVSAEESYEARIKCTINRLNEKLNFCQITD